MEGDHALLALDLNRSGGQKAPTVALTSPLGAPVIQLQTQSRLLSLPPEILTIICEFSLITSTEEVGFRILCDSSEAAPPALLHTCRILRCIGIPIFWAKNEFEVQIHEMDVRPLLAWYRLIPSSLRLLEKSGTKEDNLWVAVYDVEDAVLARINLMAWLKCMWTEIGGDHLSGTFEGRSSEGEGCFDPGETVHRLWKLFDVARAAKGMGMSWSQTQNLLSLAVEIARVLGEAAKE